MPNAAGCLTRMSRIVVFAAHRGNRQMAGIMLDAATCANEARAQLNSAQRRKACKITAVSLHQP